MEPTGICAKCGPRPLSAFTHSKANKSGCFSYCKFCYAAYMRDWKKDNAAKVKEWKRNYIARRREKIRQEKEKLFAE